MLCVLLLLTRVKDGVTNGWLGLSSHAVTVKEVGLFMDPETCLNDKPAAGYAVPVPSITPYRLQHIILFISGNSL